ncbi:unnamed protein product [Effrenium voratum]|uniref:Peptidase S54 rhomboid domain-containing protein n=1 Tax=Effrenium voratum TaxID=2562239 RepID=A0AA36JL31_9DINO|nr:unnamed protein product [Effrenium voratum]CAJ1407019.1 unnamed protein product [Effrenium voratum]CAJ1455448.1 unnamed protein product [Effrenium voratum]
MLAPIARAPRLAAKLPGFRAWEWARAAKNAPHASHEPRAAFGAAAVLGTLATRGARQGSGRQAGRGGLKEVPPFSQLRELWRRKLRISAALCLLMTLLWLLQGYQGWQNLKAFNLTQPWYKRLPSSTALESWLLGTHPVASMYGRRFAITKSTLQKDFGMDALMVDNGQFHRLLTSCFLHNSVFHILFNLGFLYTLAPLEVGCQGVFLTTFLLSGIAGNLAFLQFGQARSALGASGAICGLLGFELVALLRNRRIRRFKMLLRSTFGMIVMGFFLPGVANSAHLGGLGCGLVVALLCARRSGYRGPLLPWPLLLLLLAVPGRRFLPAAMEGLSIGIQHPGALASGIVL